MDETLPDPTGPSRARFSIVAVTSLMAMLLYLDRVCLSIMGAYIPGDLGLSDREWAWALGAFFFTYALGQVPAGRLADRFGPRVMLASCILAWSVCTAATGLAEGFAILLVARLACGLAQAGGYPTAAVLLRGWIPVDERARANSMVTLGGRIGAVVAPWITALSIVAFVSSDTPDRIGPGDVSDDRGLARDLTAAGAGPLAAIRVEIRAGLPADVLASARRLADGTPEADDREALRAGLNRLIVDGSLADGLAGAPPSLPREALAVLELPASGRSTAQVRRFNRLAIEAASPKAVRPLYRRGWRPVLFAYGAFGLIVAGLFWAVVRDGPTGRSRVKGATVPEAPEAKVGGWKVFILLATSRNMWLSGLMQGCINLGWVFLITLLPAYLGQTFDVPLEERGRMMAVPTLVGCFGMFAGGFLSDRLVRSIGLRWGRSLPIALTLFVASAALLGCRWLPTAWSVLAALAVMAVMVDLGVPSIWSFFQDVGGRNVGAALGWSNMWGNFGSALSPVLLTWIKDRGGWDAAFLTCSAAFLIAGLSGLAMNAERPLSPADDTASRARPAPP